MKAFWRLGVGSALHISIFPVQVAVAFDLPMALPAVLAGDVLLPLWLSPLLRSRLCLICLMFAVIAQARGTSALGL